MLDFLKAGRYPDDPRDLLAQITARYPDRAKVDDRESDVARETDAPRSLTNCVHGLP